MHTLSKLSLRTLVALALVSFGAACGPAEETGDDVDLGDENESPNGNLYDSGDADEPPMPGVDAKADAVLGARALPKTADDQPTQVWKVSRQWADKVNKDFSPYFKASDNITWNEAYRRFVDGLAPTQSANGGKTYKLTTPWGKTLPIAALECAEQAMFLRVTFSAWFNLPFFLEAIDGSKTRVFAGHFGFRTLAGKYKNFSNYKTAYKDYTATASSTNWVKDTALRGKKLGGDDDQSEVLGIPGATIGAYLDEIHANKRVGHFTINMLLWFGSVNLADPANTFHIKPETIRPGDMQLERWQRVGIGHTLNVKKVTALAGGKIAVELASGSMPRRQSVWESASASRRYFLLDYTGGVGETDDGVPYAKLGGGTRRWRVPALFNNGWVNMVPGDSTTAWINSTDLAAISARPERYGEILDVPDPAVRRTELTAALNTARAYQKAHPASCSNREKREEIIGELVELEYEDNGGWREDIERNLRSVEDYMFPQLKYTKSKTCCWNTTTEAMGQIVIDYNTELMNASGTCRAPVPFLQKDGGYAAFKAWAQSKGRGAAWREWSEDEPCPQRVNTNDTVEGEMVTYCE